MRRTIGLVGLLVSTASIGFGIGSALGQDLPPLIAPAEAPESTETALPADLPEPAEVSTSAGTAPMAPITELPELLPPAPAIVPETRPRTPGLPLYAGPSRPPARRTSPAAPKPTTAELPILDGPAEMEVAPPAVRTGAAPFTITPGRGVGLPPGSSRRPLVLESEPEGSGDDLEDLRRIPPTRPDGRNASPMVPSARDRERFLELTRPGAADRERSRRASDDEDEADSDPAVEAALKRRIEKIAREAVGTKVRTVDVSVMGRKITIRAHGTRFLQRRNVKKTLEGLPPLAGYRTQIEVN